MQMLHHLRVLTGRVGKSKADLIEEIHRRDTSANSRTPAQMVWVAQFESMN